MDCDSGEDFASGENMMHKFQTEVDHGSHNPDKVMETEDCSHQIAESTQMSWNQEGIW